MGKQELCKRLNELANDCESSKDYATAAVLKCLCGAVLEGKQLLLAKAMGPINEILLQSAKEKYNNSKVNLN